MKKILFLFVLISLIASCSTSKKVTNQSNNQTVTSDNLEKDGSSFNNAIVIYEKTESTGVSAEYLWLKNNYPGYTVKMQSLNYYNNKPFDIIQIKTADGIEKEIYFDISHFYGKF